MTVKDKLIDKIISKITTQNIDVKDQLRLILDKIDDEQIKKLRLSDKVKIDINISVEIKRDNKNPNMESLAQDSEEYQIGELLGVYTDSDLGVEY